MPCPRRSAEREGFALVLALWIALLVGVCGVVAMRLAAGGAGAARVEADLAAARAAAEGGIWAAAHRLALQPAGARPPRAAFTLSLGRAEVAVEMADEEGRIDLNAAPEDLLADLFRSAGLPAPEALALAARVAAWRDPAALRRRAEDAGLRGAPSGPAFRSAGELAAVPGMPRALAEALGTAVTVQTGRAQPAAEAAPPAVLAVLALGRNAAPVQAPQSAGLRTPSAGRASAAGRRTLWRIEARAVSGAVEARAAAVMDIAPGGGLPGRLLEWRPSGL